MKWGGKAIVAGVATVPMLIAGATGATYAARAATARRKGTSVEDGVPAPPPSVGLAGAVALDSLINMPMALLASVGSTRHYARAAAELDEAVAFYDRAGWLRDPSGRHPAPPDGADGHVERATRISSQGFEVLRFESGWQPIDNEPGSDRWRSFIANSTVPVRLLRHPGEPRPWLVAAHGQGMGRPSDARMLRVRRLHEQLGVNVALPVLPLHGPRSAGLAVEQQFVSNVFLLNNVFGLTQSVWDLRRLLSWLRTNQNAPAVGVLGLSLGSYVCSLLATLERDLACVIAVVPTSDLAEALRRAAPVTASRKELHRALHDERSTKVHSVVSPVARPCLVPRERRFIVAGQADRIASPSGAAELWRHWGEPSIDWRPRGHLTTPRSAAYDDHLTAILTACGIRSEQQGTH